MAGEIVMSEARKSRRARAGGGQRAFRDFSMSRWQTAAPRFANSGSPLPADRFARRPKTNSPSITVERALKHPSWVMGRKDHHRFRHAVQQRPGNDRSALAFRYRDGARRCRRSSPKRRSFDGGIRGWLDARATFHARHVPADSICADLSRTRPKRSGANQFGEARQSDL